MGHEKAVDVGSSRSGVVQNPRVRPRADEKVAFGDVLVLNHDIALGVPPDGGGLTRLEDDALVLVDDGERPDLACTAPRGCRTNAGQGNLLTEEQIERFVEALNVLFKWDVEDLNAVRAPGLLLDFGAFALDRPPVEASLVAVEEVVENGAQVPVPQAVSKE